MSCFRPSYVTFNRGQFGKFGGRLTQGVLDAYADSETEVVPVPCGHCIGCRLDRSKAWSDRMLLEYNTDRDTYSKHTALFVTLTYDEVSLPRFVCSDGMTRGNLNVVDIQNFMKRLRKFLNHKVRFFCAGEYGDTTFRPHYHMILFGCSLSDFPDIAVYSHDFELHQDLFFSPTLDRVWGKGSCKFCPASYGTMAYVAQYVIKKQFVCDNVDSFYRGRKPPFITMSRRPGIGSDFFGEDCFDDDLLVPSVAVNDGDDVHIVKIPRSYLEKLKLTNQDLYDNIMSNRRSLASSADSFVKEQVGDRYFDYLRSCESSVYRRSKSLHNRNKV
ncbi:replication initiator protein [Microvirus mar25]|uniref:Replication initiator protein n=1 Tax=Microvirus mar25 TaxID=2851158 RepID=A0A8F5MJ32_9VIRU|nr:replication initiator protein [Microvirus mar25]